MPASHPLPKPLLVRLTVFIIEILLLIAVLALDITYHLSSGRIQAIMIAVYVLTAAILFSNIFGMLRMRFYEKMHREYLRRQSGALPLMEEIRCSHHDLANQFQTLKLAVESIEGYPEVVSYTRALEDRLKQLSMSLKTDRLIINALLVEKYREAAKKGVELNIDCQNRDFSCIMDDFALTAVLSNLLQNAIEASPSGSRIHMTLTKDDAYAIVRLKNPGVLTVADTEELFRFGFTGKQGGRGIGLYNVHKLAADFGGKVEVQQDAGLVTFSLYIPLIKPPASDQSVV